MADIINPHDKFFKAIFSRPEVAKDFLSQCLPLEISELLDPDSIALAKDSFINHALHEQFSDILYTANFKSGSQLYLYLLFEHKSYPEPLIAFHLLRYMIQIWEQDLKNNPSHSFRPIIPIVLYHGEYKWNIATDFHSLFPDIESLRNHLPDFQYILYDTHQYGDDEIQGEWLFRSAIIVMKYIFREEFPDKMNLIFRLIQEKGRDSIREILEIMVNYITNATDRVSRNDLIIEIKNTFHEIGADIMPTIAEQFRSEGRTEGIKETSRNDILDILDTRFTFVPSTIKSRLDRIEDPVLLKKLLKSAVLVSTTEEFLQRIDEE